MSKLGGSKQKKMNSRVDFTPMVDMIMLLVTFFMLCTTLLKPQTMDITMPSDKDDIKEENKSQVAADKAITIILDKEDAVYYFTGKPSEAKLEKDHLWAPRHSQSPDGREPGSRAEGSSPQQGIPEPLLRRPQAGCRQPSRV